MKHQFFLKKFQKKFLSKFRIKKSLIISSFPIFYK